MECHKRRAALNPGCCTPIILQAWDAPIVGKQAKRAHWLRFGDRVGPLSVPIASVCMGAPVGGHRGMSTDAVTQRTPVDRNKTGQVAACFSVSTFVRTEPDRPSNAQ